MWKVPRCKTVFKLAIWLPAQRFDLSLSLSQTRVLQLLVGGSGRQPRNAKQGSVRKSTRHYVFNPTLTPVYLLLARGPLAARADRIPVPAPTSMTTWYRLYTYDFAGQVPFSERKAADLHPKGKHDLARMPLHLLQDKFQPNSISKT